MAAVAAACGALIAVVPAAVHADGGIPASGVVTGVWTVADASTTVVDGALTFADGARVALANESLFANVGSGGIPIAVASAGIVGEPAMVNYDFGLKLSGRINLRGGILDVANLMGSPDVTNAAPFGVAGLWTIEDDTPMTVTGTLAFRNGARVVIADESLFASVGREGRVVATATGGISGLPEMVNYDFALKLSADGKSLIVYDNIPDVVDWTVFTRKATVAFGGVQQGVVLTNFPVLVKLSAAVPGFSYSDFKRPNGVELRFADAGGNLIPHEIDTWDTNGVSAVWVKVPLLSKDSAITAWYGCTRPGRAMPTKSVWDDDYVGVWHLGESELPLRESSETTRDFSSAAGSGISYAASGIVGGSVDFSNGTSSSVVAPDHDKLDGFDKFTLETWTWQAELKSNAGVISKREAYNKEVAYYLFESVSTNGNYMPICAGTNRNGSVGWTYHQKPTAGSWVHMAYSVDMTTSTSNLRGYKNGVENGWVASMKFLATMPNCASDLYLGNLDAGGGGAFNGKIDEVRISKAIRSAAWMKATYDTVTKSDFATYMVEAIEPQYAFAHEVGVAFTGYSGGSTLSDFPVLVRLSPNIPGFSYADFAIASGGDLRFFDAVGRLLPHEIDTWNTNGVSSVWVKVPSLTASTAITAKYGCEAPPDNDPGSVWSNGYVGVWHLGESDLPLRESSETSSDFASKSGSTITFAAPGVVGGSVDFSGGVNNSVVASDHDALDGFSKFTIELWTYQDVWKKGAGVLAKKVTDRRELAYSMFETLTTSGTWTMPIMVGTSRDAGTDWSYHQPPATNRWSHTAFTVDMTTSSSNIHGFKNGNMNGWVSSKNYPSTMPNCASDLCLGNSVKGASNGFPGKIDEVRISNVIRSADWIKATYDTIMSPGFATYSTAVGTLSGYGAWMNAKELVGAPAEAAANGIENGVRYAFDIAPEKGPDSIGTPIIQVVRDANGNPSVQSRNLATGRDDVTFGILATPDLTDWSNAKLVPMEKFATDGLWRPTASETSGYVFPSQMFFKYTVEVK